MSVKILNDALKADRLKLKGGALHMFHIICFRAGSGHPTKWGKVMPLGEWRATDKKIMRLMHLNTKKDVRTTIRRWRKAIEATGVLSWVVGRHGDKQAWPSHLYTVDTAGLESMRTNKSMRTKRTAQNVRIQTGDDAHKTHAQVGVVTYTDGSAPSFDPSRGDSGARGSGVAVQPLPDQTGFPSTDSPPTEEPSDEVKLVQKSLTVSGYTADIDDTVKFIEALGSDRDDFIKYLQSKQGAWLPKKTKGQVPFLLKRLESTDKNSALAQFHTWLVKKLHDDEVFYRTHCKHCDEEFNTDGVCRAWRVCPGGIDGNPPRKAKYERKFKGQLIHGPGIDKITKPEAEMCADEKDMRSLKPAGFVVNDI